MKKYAQPILILIVGIILSASRAGWAQSPQSFNYQAIVRDTGGEPIAGQAVSIRISLHQGSEAGTIVYAETHAVTTSPLGLVNLEIGTGTVASGSFPDIPWETGLYYLEMELDPSGGTSYVTLGTTLLVSVPYALYSESTAQEYSAGTGIDITDHTISNTTPDQVVSITAGSGISTGGTYPNFTVANTAPDQAVSLTAGTGISIGGTYPGFTVANTAPNANHTGDATGSGALTVERIQGRPVSSAAPNMNQVLQWNGGQWAPATLSGASPGWLLTGNSGTDPNVNFIGTTDNQPLRIRINNVYSGEINPINNNLFLGKQAGKNSTGFSNVAIGPGALYENTVRSHLVAIGDSALYNNGKNVTMWEHARGNTAIGSKALYSNTTGHYNTAAGDMALYTNATASDNTALGYHSLYFNNTGSNNTSIGSYSLSANSTGEQNTAIGPSSLFHNTEGDRNVASGYQALYSNDSGSKNIAVGSNALNGNTSGSNNTAIGDYALSLNSTGYSNVAIGIRAIYRNTSRSNLVAVGDSALFNNGTGAIQSYHATSNTAIGSKALYNNTTGSGNTASGYQALRDNTTGYYNTAYAVYALHFNTTGNNNTACGFNALYYNTTGYSNVAIGIKTLWNNTTRSNLVAVGDSALYKNGMNASDPDHATGNTAIGSKALFSNTTGYRNTASGYQTLQANSTGGWNTASGYQSLYANTVGTGNQAFGPQALYYNTTGNNNHAIGRAALYKNTTGYSNVAIGTRALFENTDRSNLIAIGDSALYKNGLNTTMYYEAQDNAAIGSKALRFNTTGYNNVAIGNQALYSNTTGSWNTACGDGALSINTEGDDNTAVGSAAGNYNMCSGGTFLGSMAYPYPGATNNCMALGYHAHVSESNRVVIGNSAVSSIGGYAGWTDFSDGRFKNNVREDVPGLEFIRQLRPVTYTLDITSLNADLNKNSPAKLREGEKSAEESPEDKASMAAKEKIIYTGFIAQEVEAAARSMGYDFSGVDAPQNPDGHYGLRYAEFVVPLVKAIQEQQAMIEALQEEVKRLKENQAAK